MARRQDPVGFTLSLVGGAGSGKTELALGGPRPLTLISVDPNTKAITRKLELDDVDDVTAHHLTMPALAFDERDDIKEEAAEKWELIRSCLRPIVKGKVDCRTVVLDTATEQYSLGGLMLFGKGDQILPETRRNMMGPVNSRWKGIVQALEQRGVNVILIHRAKEAWESVIENTDKGEREIRRKMTGPFDMEREGYNGTPFMVSTEVFLSFDPNRESKNLAGKFGMKIVRCQQRPGLINREYWGREKVDDARVRKSSFAYLATLLYPDTTLSDWS